MKALKTKILPSVSLRFTALATAFLVAGGLLLAPSISRADPQDDAAFTCASAVNVMDCIQKTGTGAPAPKAADITAVPVSTQALGFSGPITAGIRYDNYLAWILDVGYSQQFYNAAAAFKLSAGLNERRANVTLGYSITPKQQIKLTYEYLSQNLPFDYASGTVNEWVSQNALGGAYRYILDNGIVRALDVYGTYTKASSKNLSNVEMYTDDVLTAINYRRIAGGTEMTAGTNITLTPFKNTIIKLGGGYSTLSFDTQWEDSAATAAIAYNAELSHLLTPTTLISTGIGNTASGTTYTTKISQILPWSLEASLMGQYTATTNDIPGSSSVTAQLSYPAPKTYTNMFADGIGKLKDWVEKPVLYQTRVLAKAEEKVVQVQITTTPIPPAIVAVGTQLTPTIQTKDYFNFNQEVFDKINYQIASITQKGNDQNVFTPANLGLQVVPVDTFNAVLSSYANMQTAAMTPGDYTVTLQASGYYNGQVVSQVNNPVDISVPANANLAAPTWVTGAQLPAATANATSYSANLTSLVKNNSGVADESYTFTLSNNPTWLSLGGANNQFLVLTSGATVPQTANSASVNLNATSNASGNKTGTQNFVINITGGAAGPVWTQNPNVVSIKYPQTAPTKIFVLNNQYVTTVGAVTASNFSLTNNVPSNAIQNMTTDASGTYVTVNPPALNDIGNTGSFSLTATDSNGQSTGNFTVPIIASSATDLTLPNWLQPTPDIPAATVGVKYESNNTVILNPYSSPATVYLNKTTTTGANPTVVDDQLTFAKNDSGKSDACTWMLIDSNTGQLTGTPSQPQNCKLYVNVTSKAAGSTYALDSKGITVVGSTPWSSDLTGNIYYDPINYNSNKPFAFYIVPSAYISGSPTISNIQIPNNLPSGGIKKQIVLDSPNKGNAYVPIDPSNIGDVSNQGQFSVDATVTGGTPVPGLFTINIIPNPNFIPAQENTSAQLPDANYSGTPYSVIINPYNRSATNPDNQPADYYISFTKSSSDASAITVNDILTFAQITDANTCQWAQLTTDGVIQQKTDVTGSNCTIQAKVTSRATGKTFDYAANILVGQPITWSTNNTTGSGIKFDDFSSSFTLNNFIQAGGDDPALVIRFADGTSQWSNWEIKAESQGSNKPALYKLYRYVNPASPTANAADVTNTNVEIKLIAINSNPQSLQGTPGSVFVTSIDSDPNVIARWVTGTTLTGAVASPSNILIKPSYFQTCTDSSCNTPVINDAITVGNQTSPAVVSFPNNLSGSISNGNLTIPNLQSNADSLSYDLNFTNIASKAKGGTATVTASAALFITPSMALKTYSGSMAFDVTTATSEAVNLSNLLVYGNADGIQFVLQSGQNFKVIASGTPTTYYLVRNSTQDSNSRTHIEAGDIGQTVSVSVTANYKGSTTGQTSQTLSITVLAAPSSRYGTYQILWDPYYTPSKATYTVGSGPMSINLAHNQVKTCTLGQTSGNTRYCGNIIVDNDTLTFPPAVIILKSTGGQATTTFPSGSAPTLTSAGVITISPTSKPVTAQDLGSYNFTFNYIRTTANPNIPTQNLLTVSPVDWLTITKP